VKNAGPVRCPVGRRFGLRVIAHHDSSGLAPRRLSPASSPAIVPSCQWRGRHTPASCPAWLGFPS
jgi:hypothetical protein